jgi:hypothetical protein
MILAPYERAGARHAPWTIELECAGLGRADRPFADRGGGSTRMEAQDFIVDRSLVYEKDVCGIIL